MDLTRRTVVAGSGALGTASLLPSGAFAKAPLSTAQTVGFHRFKLGSFDVIALHDGAVAFPLPKGFVRNATDADVAKAFADTGLPSDKLTITFTTMVVNTGDKVVLFDTGFGNNGQPTTGNTAAALAAAGIAAKDVDAVVFSHFHGDHINGVRSKEGALVYPNAQIMVPEAEWAFWMNDENMAKAPDAMKGAFANVRRAFDKMGDRLTHYEMDKEVAPGLTPFATHGHTPGHTSFTLQSGTGKLIIQSDVTNNPALFLRNPGWHVMYDMNPQQAEATRRAFFDRAAADKTLIAGFHYPFPSLGYVEKDGANNFRLVPASWQTKI
jgi:glyoxylase-like metal-dependent hydrolase (beta-lactamase superfamily II)